MKILVATDGSRGGAAAVKFAARLASGDHGSELVILTIAKPEDAARAGPPEKAPREGEAPAVVALNPASAQKILDGAVRDAERSGAHANIRFVTADGRTPVPEAISREADRFKADLVVVGSEGRDTLNEWVLGGTALRLIYVARRPVAVVRPPRRRKAS